MFNDIKAPFFHFSHALDFPTLGREFTDFLAGVYRERTGQDLDWDKLYSVFVQFDKSPMYIRAVIQDLIINPALSLEAAANARLTQMQENGNFPRQWNALSAMERLLLQSVARGDTSPYGAEFRAKAACTLGVETVKASSVQNAVRKLLRKDLMAKDSGGAFRINSPMLQAWINENVE